MLTALFWLLVICTVYSYFLYPVVLWFLGRSGADAGGGELQGAAEKLPSLSLIVTAYNEEKRILAKIENSLLIDYAGELEIIIASDCSDDGTDALVNGFAERGVRLVRADQRLGKENAQRCAIEQAQGALLVFSDVATEIPSDALTKLVVHFNDNTVGAVSSEDRFISRDGSVAGEGAYVKYEMWLRRKESALAGLVGLSGSFFAARKTVCEQWDISSPSDFNTALNCANLGLRAVTAPDVLGFYQDIQDPQKEYQRKVRTVLRGIAALASHAEVLSFKRYGLFSFEVFSHKLMRWLVPWFLLLLFVVTCALAGQHGFYSLALVGQLAFYGLAVAAHMNSGLKDNALVRIVYFFVQVNVAIADASIQFLRGKRMTVWQPSAR
jgi:cellulose synthase/poly-beta-1,6-N-acetylglucosamine synthase-like glycosyltransferase